MPTSRKRGRRWGDGGGGEDGGAVALEGERGQEADAVELGPGTELDPGGPDRRVDLGPEGGPGGREEELEPSEVAEGDTGHAHQGVVVDGDDEDELLLEEGFERQVPTGDGKGEDGHVEAAGGQLGLQARGRPVGHHQMEQGMFQGEVGQEHRGDPAGGGADHADADRPPHLHGAAPPGRR